MTTTRAAVAEGGDSPFTLSEIDLAEPRPDEAVVRIVAAGVCHTDLGVAAGALPFPLPGVLGHEGAGVVESVGAAVRGIEPGDHVLLSFTSCGGCAGCRGGHPAYCAQWLPLNLIGGRRADGSHTLTRGGTPIGGHFFGQSSFSEHAIVHSRSMIRVDPELPLDTLAPLGCGVLTGTGAVWNVLAPRPGASIVVLGAGAVGLSAVMAAALTPATVIITVDRVPERLTLASELGATHTVDATTADIADAVSEIVGGRGVDGVVETTGNTAVLRTGADLLAPRGTLAVVGAPPFGTDVALDVNALLSGRRIVGITLGDNETQTAIPALVDLVASGRLPVDKLITRYPFTDIDTAVRDMISGKTIKPVLTFG